MNLLYALCLFAAAILIVVAVLMCQLEERLRGVLLILMALGCVFAGVLLLNSWRLTAAVRCKPSSLCA